MASRQRLCATGHADRSDYGAIPHHTGTVTVVFPWATPAVATGPSPGTVGRSGRLPRDGPGGDGVDGGGSHHSQTGRLGRWSIGADCSTRVHRHRRPAGRGPLQENITAPKRIDASRRNVQASRQRPGPACSGSGDDLPAGQGGERPSRNSPTADITVEGGESGGGCPGVSVTVRDP